jgi:hypothetical protein
MLRLIDSFVPGRLEEHVLALAACNDVGIMFTERKRYDNMNGTYRNKDVLSSTPWTFDGCSVLFLPLS